MRILDVLTDERRWRKGDLGQLGEPRCLEGAVMEAYGAYGLKAIRDRIREAIAMLYPERAVLGIVGGTRIDKFNDHPDTTFADIQRVCKFADV